MIPGLTARLQYEFTGEFGDALLFRFPDDPEPVQISAPRGVVEVRLRDPQTLYWQVLDGTDDVRISCIGFTFPEGFAG